MNSKIRLDISIYSKWICTGNPLKQSRLSTIQEHNINCGVDVSDGLIFTGWNNVSYGDFSAKSGKTLITVPWIEKTDKEGNLLWEKTFAEDVDNEVTQLHFRPRDQSNCKDITVSPSGMIVWATIVDGLKMKQVDGKNVPDKDNRSAGLSSLRPKMIAFELDQKGNETHQLIAEDVDQAFVFPLSGGFSLAEHFRPHVPDFILKLSPLQAVGAILSANAYDGGMRVNRLDANLKIIKADEYKTS